MGPCSFSFSCFGHRFNFLENLSDGPGGALGCRCAGALPWKWPGQLDSRLSERRASGRPPPLGDAAPWLAERCAGNAARRQGSGWCGLMACQMSMSSWKILYEICRSVSTGPLLRLLQTAPSFRTTPAPPLFPTELQSRRAGLELRPFRLPLASIPRPSVLPQAQA